jgi:hypothetical protein
MTDPLAVKDTRGIRTAAAAVLLLCLLAWLSGCAGTGGSPEPISPAPEWSEETPQSVLNELRRQRANLETVSAYFSLSLASPPPGQPSTMQGVLFVRFGQQEPLFRIQVLRPFGGVALDMVMDGDRLRAYVPARETLYTGRSRDLDRSGTGPGELFRTGIMNPAALTAKSSELLIQGDRVLLQLVGGRLELNRQTGRVQAWQGRERRVTYGDYQRVGSSWLPGRIRVENDSGEQLAECRIREVQALPEKQGLFDLSEYEARQVKPLDRLLGSSS